MTTLAKINKAKEETAKEINTKIYELFENMDSDDNWADALFMKITTYIEKEHLFKSDYTK